MREQPQHGLKRPDTCVQPEECAISNRRHCDHCRRNNNWHSHDNTVWGLRRGLIFGFALSIGYACPSTKQRLSSRSKLLILQQKHIEGHSGNWVGREADRACFSQRIDGFANIGCFKQLHGHFGVFKLFKKVVDAVGVLSTKVSCWVKMKMLITITTGVSSFASFSASLASDLS